MRGFIRSRGVGAKIRFGYALIGLILVSTVAVTIWQVHRTATVTNRMIELRAPTAQASLGMLNGMNHSLAALRGWIILGKDKFKEERGKAWSEEINPALAAMEKFAVNWTDPENITRLGIIKKKLVDFELFQKEIEDIAQAIENTPASEILFEDAAPKAKILAEQITKMIDLEANLDSTPERKALLGMMADTRGTLGLGLGAIRAYLLSGDENFREQFDRLWAKNTRRFGDLSENITLLTPEQREAYDIFAETRKQFDPLPRKMFEIRGSDGWNLANLWLGTKAAPTAFGIKENLDAMIVSQNALMETDMKESAKLTASLISTEWILLGVGTILCVLLGWIITRTITRPINHTVMDLSAGAEQVTAASEQVAQSSQSMAEGSTEQAASMEEMSASLEELTAMTRQNTDNSNEAKSLSSQAQTDADAGNEAMQRLSRAIDDIKKSADETAGIVKTIEEIAFQTNLLALNAAVEAARAGEAGKGFAVVAEEVRNLAQRAAIAARSTGDLISESVRNAENGVAISSEVAKSLKKIADVSMKVNQIMGEVAAASGEQAQGIDQINTAVSQVDQVTQTNAATSEESAAAAEELSAQAAEMMSIVRNLSELVGGNYAQEEGHLLPLSSTGIEDGDHSSPTQRRQEQSVVIHSGSRQKVIKPTEVLSLDDDDLVGF